MSDAFTANALPDGAPAPTDESAGGIVWPGEGGPPSDPAAAFAAAWEGERPALLAYARARLGDGDAAEEIVQEAFARLWATLPATPALHAGAWLFTVVRNLARDRFRARRRHPQVAWADWLGDHAGAAASAHADPAAQVAAAAEAGAVRRVLTALPPRYREALVLRYWRGHTVAEIAAILTAARDRGRPTDAIRPPITIACVKWRLVEARRRFERRWRDDAASADAPVWPSPVATPSHRGGSDHEHDRSGRRLDRGAAPTHRAAGAARAGAERRAAVAGRDGGGPAGLLEGARLRPVGERQAAVRRAAVGHRADRPGEAHQGVRPGGVDRRARPRCAAAGAADGVEEPGRLTVARADGTRATRRRGGR
jgi:RNA polymerase sigma-70 factor (ECF subfamily)